MIIGNPKASKICSKNKLLILPNSQTCNHAEQVLAGFNGYQQKSSIRAYNF